MRVTLLRFSVFAASALQPVAAEDSTYYRISAPAVSGITEISHARPTTHQSGNDPVEEVAEPIKELAPVRRLVGRWRSEDDSGTTSHDLRWVLRMKKKWLFERFRIGGESGTGGSTRSERPWSPGGGGWSGLRERGVVNACSDSANDAGTVRVLLGVSSSGLAS
jgi:hypothetical protein